MNAIAPLLLQSTVGYLKKPQVEFAHKVTFSVSTVLRQIAIMEKLPIRGAGWQVLGTEKGDEDWGQRHLEGETEYVYREANIVTASNILEHFLKGL